MKLENRVAVITGGGRGIGRSISLALAEAGADIVIAARTLAPAKKVAQEVEALGRRCLALQVDVSNYFSVQQAVETIVSSFGRIDILVNNAGGSARGKMSLFCDSEPDTWNEVIGTNLIGVFHTCRAVINGMLEQGAGSIINIGSVAGMIGLPSQADYSAAKGAVIAFSKALAKESVKQGVRVNCVSPGPIKSEAGRSIPPEMRKNLAVQALIDSTGYSEFGDPDDIAKLVTFLASEDAKFITGQNYPVCGLMNLGLNVSISG
ncbi:SDR family NAD(P)-dependent oxidoreductase [Halioxenophilus sp. WMMB6]|uniref:SDR family NAD(P)-dependent oxidoreductase n=1 Tax=Halioxenophilus sp. WMMB6 TaxID=3073815 RepID=UPI00295EE8DD|nr:SDR family NAD(P)-dependent oxidoreductase [Halioxenophilus sp. WMMB6]